MSQHRLTEHELAEMERTPHLRRLVAEIRTERARADFMRHTLHETANALEAALAIEWDHQRLEYHDTLLAARKALA